MDDYLGQKMLDMSGIKDSDLYNNYITNYQAYVDGDGYYLNEDDIVEGSGTKISFATNSNLKIKYFKDVNHQEEINISDCYLTTGDSIYAEVNVSRNVYSNTYEFCEFRFYELDDEGFFASEAVDLIQDGNEYIITFGNIDDIDLIKIEPVGDYKNRFVTLNEYCLDNDKKQNVSGKWLVNENVCEAGEIEINPFESYIISYEYDVDQYFFVSSTPDCFYSSYIEGIIVFNQRDAYDETLEYTVELHKYISVSLLTKEARNVKIASGNSTSQENQYINAGKALDISSLRYGETIVILTDKKWEDLKNIDDLVFSKEIELAQVDAYKIDNSSWYKYRYELFVPEENGKFRFNPEEYEYEHGEIYFTYHGERIDSELVLAKGRRIEYHELSADDGYWLAGDSDDHFIIIEDEDETREKIKNIKFSHKSPVTVTLPQPKAGGKIIYKIDGKQISDSKIETYSGTVITIDFVPWEGWICNIQNGKEYIVSDINSSQTLTIENVTIDQIFYEDPNHKPKLNVNLDDSVGTSMVFTVTASNYSIEASYDGGYWNITDLFNKRPVQYIPFTNTQILVEKQEIGTDEPIVVDLTNRAIQSGTAIKMVITKTDSDNIKSTTTRYYTDPRKANEPIYIYQKGYEDSTTTWYSSIDISISVVDIEIHKLPNSLTNTTINVKRISDDKYLTTDTLIEPAEKVVVTIRANYGYYLTGSKVTNDSYIQEMKYSEYLNKIESIISEHPAEKYITITLDASDSFAVYSYKRDGAEVNGTINVKPNTKIELTYEITDSTHKLNKSYGGFIGIGASNKKATVSLTISYQYDGKTLKKEDFGLELE